MVFEAEVIDGIVRINCLGSIYGSTIEDSDVIMSIVIDKILEIKKVERIILAETREYEYDYEQTKLLVEVANAYNRLVNELKILNIRRFALPGCDRFVAKWFGDTQFLVLELLRRDPIGAYVTVRRQIRRIKLKVEKSSELYARKCYKHYLENVLIPIKEELEKLKLIQIVQDKLDGYKLGDRSLYRQIFHPLIRPNFMLTRYMATPPKNGRLVKKYRVGNGDIIVEIFRIPGKVRYFYFVSPPEFRLSEEKYAILDTARRYMAEHKPSRTEFTQPEKAREIFLNIGRDLIREIARSRGVELSSDELEQLAQILARYTAGFGILEVLLADENIQDIYINSPVGLTPIYVKHADFDECETNLIPTREDAESWATRFRMFSGRPLDEANPVLDTELEVPGGRARVCAITRTLSPEGLGFALRRHRDRPWTYPLFIDVKYMNPLFAGLMSFIIDGSRSFLVAGTRGSGKTSFLGASMLEIMKKFRIITVEDSVTGDCRILIRRNGKIERVRIGDLVDELIRKYGYEKKFGREVVKNIPEKIEVFSFDEKGKISISPVSFFVRHKVKKDIYEIETTTGRKIRVTEDHSIFTIGETTVMRPVKASQIKVGDYIATPRVLKLNNGRKKHIDLLNYLERFEELYVCGQPVRAMIEKNWDSVKELKKKYGYSRNIHSYWKRKGILPVRIFKELVKKREINNLEKVYLKPKNSNRKVPVKIELTKEFLNFIGLWLSDGYYNAKSVIISTTGKEVEEVVRAVANQLGIEVKRHANRRGLMLNSVVLRRVLEVLGLEGNVHSKRVPEWVYNLSREQIAEVLKGIFSGDGYVGKHEVFLSLASEEMLHDVQTLLLFFGIILRKSNERKSDGKLIASITSLKFLKKFKDRIGFLQLKKQVKLERICEKVSAHDASDVIPLSLTVKNEIKKVWKDFNTHDYVTRNYSIGRGQLKRIINEAQVTGLNPLEFLANSDIFWDRVKKVRKLKKKYVYVYDISVPGNENFVCENIIAHNTLELPVPQLRNLGYNIERLKSRSVITRVESELPADEALRTALRLGDSCLIIGEVRSTEAKALFEAMRIGALANVVAGTIHGESPYGVFDRVVNDLGVPPTSFKAMDVIIIANVLRSPDGLHTFRRIMELTEVRKHWKHDPMEEEGFVTLLRYDAKKDELVPTDTLLSGESFVLNEIMRRVREWKDNWEAVWDNIMLRAKIKQTMVDYANKLGNKEILEAPMVVQSNEMFHMISEKVREEVGALDSKMIYDRWLEWFKKKLKEGT